MQGKIYAWQIARCYTYPCVFLSHTFISLYIFSYPVHDYPQYAVLQYFVPYSLESATVPSVTVYSPINSKERLNKCNTTFFKVQVLMIITITYKTLRVLVKFISFLQILWCAVLPAVTEDTMQHLPRWQHIFFSW